MGVLPKIYSKKDFKSFLVNNDTNEIIISKFVKLPKLIIKDDNTFDLYINCVQYKMDKEYDYELNYYSEDKIEFLFSLKVFEDVELSINNLLVELKNM